jgi:hypothetical protein
MAKSDYLCGFRNRAGEAIIIGNREQLAERIANGEIGDCDELFDPVTEQLIFARDFVPYAKLITLRRRISFLDRRVASSVIFTIGVISLWVGMTNFKLVHEELLPKLLMAGIPLSFGYLALVIRSSYRELGQGPWCWRFFRHAILSALGFPVFFAGVVLVANGVFDREDSQQASAEVLRLGHSTTSRKARSSESFTAVVRSWRNGVDEVRISGSGSEFRRIRVGETVTFTVHSGWFGLEWIE